MFICSASCWAEATAVSIWEEGEGRFLIFSQTSLSAKSMVVQLHLFMALISDIKHCAPTASFSTMRFAAKWFKEHLYKCVNA